MSWAVGTSSSPLVLNPAAAGVSYSNGVNFSHGGLTLTPVIDAGNSVATVAGACKGVSGNDTSMRFTFNSAASGTQNACVDVPVTTTGADVIDVTFWVRFNPADLPANKGIYVCSLYMTDKRYSLVIQRRTGVGLNGRVQIIIQDAASPYPSAGPNKNKTMRWSDTTAITTSMYCTDGICHAGEWSQIRWRTSGWLAYATTKITGELWVDGVKCSFDPNFDAGTDLATSYSHGLMTGPVTKVRLGCANNPGGTQVNAVVDIGAVSVSLDETDGAMQSDPVVAVRPMGGKGIGVVTTSVLPSVATLAWGTTSTKLTDKILMTQSAIDTVDGLSYTNHCELPDVAAGDFYYQISYADARGTWLGKIYHATIPDEDDTLTVVGIGDTQSYRALHVLPATAAAKNPNLVLQAGDITNYCSSDFFPTVDDYQDADSNRWEWVRNIGALKPLTAKCPILTIGGNHDWFDDHDADAFYGRIGVAEEIPNSASVGKSYGRIADFGMLRIAAIDVWWSVHSDWSAELDWLRKALDAPHKAWRIFLCHYPAFGYPSLGGSFEPLGFRSELQALCEEYGVQLAISGHTNSPAIVNINGATTHLNLGTPADGGDYRNIFTLCDSTNQPGAGTWIKLHAPTGGTGLQPVTEAVPGYWILTFSKAECTLKFMAMSDDSVVYRTRILNRKSAL